MKKIFASTLLISLVLLCSSQVSIPTGTPQQVNSFYRGKTYFVLDNQMMSDYNDYMEEAAEKIWTITPVEFIKLSDFESKRKESNSSFLMINQVTFDADKSNTFFDFLVLIAGGNYKSVNEMPLLAAVPLCYNGSDETDWEFKIPLGVRFVQMHMQTIKQHPEITSKNAIDYYMNKKGNLSQTTLYIKKSDLESSLRNENAFKSIYPYPFKFTDDNEISQLITDADPNSLILHIISPIDANQTNKCVKMIINPGTAMIYYYDMHAIGGNKPALFLEDDLKKMAKP